MAAGMTHLDAFVGLLYIQSIRRPDIFFAMLGNRANGELVLEETWDTASEASGEAPEFEMGEIERHTFHINDRPGVYLVFPEQAPVRAIAAVLTTPLNMDTMQFDEGAAARFFEVREAEGFEMSERESDALKPVAKLTACIDKQELVETISGLLKLAHTPEV